jgi:hypothetical protein
LTKHGWTAHNVDYPRITRRELLSDFHAFIWADHHFKQRIDAVISSGSEVGSEITYSPQKSGIGYAPVIKSPSKSKGTKGPEEGQSDSEAESEAESDDLNVAPNHYLRGSRIGLTKEGCVRFQRTHSYANGPGCLGRLVIVRGKVVKQTLTETPTGTPTETPTGTPTETPTGNKPGAEPPAETEFQIPPTEMTMDLAYLLLDESGTVHRMDSTRDPGSWYEATDKTRPIFIHAFVVNPVLKEKIGNNHGGNNHGGNNHGNNSNDLEREIWNFARSRLVEDYRVPRVPPRGLSIRVKFGPGPPRPRWAVGETLFSKEGENGARETVGKEKEQGETKQGEKEEGEKECGEKVGKAKEHGEKEQDEKQGGKEVSHGGAELSTEAAEKQAYAEREEVERKEVERKEVFLRAWNAERERVLRESKDDANKFEFLLALGDAERAAFVGGHEFWEKEMGAETERERLVTNIPDDGNGDEDESDEDESDEYGDEDRYVFENSKYSE